MKTVLILGGRLQGVEAAYLMKKAGWHTIVVDVDSAAAAQGIADEFRVGDIMTVPWLAEAMQTADLVIPALEELDVLEYITEIATETGARLMFSLPSYRISCSKLVSDRMFQCLHVPAPTPWPDCSFPIIVKPSGQSGSEGVVHIADQQELGRYEQLYGSLDGQVAQEYVSGPSYSIEIIAHQGHMKTFQVTKLDMDEQFDCKRVLCPSGLPRDMEQQFADCAATLAAAVMLEGIMDVEAILHDGELKVLEIDARLPSQTLTAVYQSTGAIAPAAYAEEDLERGTMYDHTFAPATGVIYEHVLVKGHTLRIQGEHIMGGQGPLRWQKDFFGADEALTSYEPGKQCWVATLILRGRDRAAVWQKHLEVMHRIMTDCGLTEYYDEEPAPYAGDKAAGTDDTLKEEAI